MLRTTEACTGVPAVAQWAGGDIMELFREKEVVRMCAPMVRYSK